jgi:hypothetical protein
MRDELVGRLKRVDLKVGFGHKKGRGGAVAARRRKGWKMREEKVGQIGPKPDFGTSQLLTAAGAEISGGFNPFS